VDTDWVDVVSLICVLSKILRHIDLKLVFGDKELRIALTTAPCLNRETGDMTVRESR